MIFQVSETGAKAMSLNSFVLGFWTKYDLVIDRAQWRRERMTEAVIEWKFKHERTKQKSFIVLEFTQHTYILHLRFSMGIAR